MPSRCRVSRPVRAALALALPNLPLPVPPSPPGIAGFCVTVAVTDTQSGAVLFQEEIHTSVAAPGSAPVLSRRRRLRGLGGGAGAPQRALGRGRARAAGQR